MGAQEKVLGSASRSANNTTAGRANSSCQLQLQLSKPKFVKKSSQLQLQLSKPKFVKKSSTQKLMTMVSGWLWSSMEMFKVCRLW